MLKKLTKDENSNVVAGLSNLPQEIHDLLCSGYCEEYCGTKKGSDGRIWSANRSMR